MSSALYNALGAIDRRESGLVVVDMSIKHRRSHYNMYRGRDVCHGQNGSLNVPASVTSSPNNTGTVSAITTLSEE